MKPLIGVIIPILLLFAACQKDPDKNASITMGKTEGMKITSLDTIIAGAYNQAVQFNIDLNKDGTDDIQFMSGVYGSPGMGQHPFASLTCLHSDLKIHGLLQNDTTFFSTYVTSNVNPEGITEIYEQQKFACIQSSPDDSIVSIKHNAFKPIVLSNGESVSLENLFKSDTLKLTSDWMVYPPSYHQISPDTLVISRRYYYYDCFSFPDFQVSYLAFSLQKAKRPAWAG